MARQNRIQAHSIKIREDIGILWMPLLFSFIPVRLIFFFHILYDQWSLLQIFTCISCLPAHAGKRQFMAPGGRFRPENDKSCRRQTSQ
jgi:hypothetical protein